MQTKYNPFDEIPALDTERLMNDLYFMRASFDMIFHQLASQPSSEWDRPLLESLLTVNAIIQCRHPSLTRH